MQLFLMATGGGITNNVSQRFLWHLHNKLKELHIYFYFCIYVGIYLFI